MMSCVKKRQTVRFGVYIQGVCAVERMLQKIAKQLCGFDEASLMELWERYAKKVACSRTLPRVGRGGHHFNPDPGYAPEKPAFNHHWSESLKANPQPLSEGQLPVFSLHPKTEDPKSEAKDVQGDSQPGAAASAVSGVDRQERGKVLSFRTVKDD